MALKYENTITKYDRGKETLREVRMWMNSAFLVFFKFAVTVVGMLVFVLGVCHVRDNFSAWNEKRLLRKNAKKIIYDAIDEKFDAMAVGQYLKLPIEWQGDFADGVRKFIPEFMIPNILRYQSFFNQLLKAYANDLVFLCDQEEQLNRTYKGKSRQLSMSGEEILNIVRRKSEIEGRIKCVKKSFWKLHDTLNAIGLETWGHLGFETYVLLAPSYFAETLKDIELY